MCANRIGSVYSFLSPHAYRAVSVFFCDKELSYLLGRLDFVINYVFDALVCTKHGDMQLQLSIPKFALMF